MEATVPDADPWRTARTAVTAPGHPARFRWRRPVASQGLWRNDQTGACGAESDPSNRAGFSGDGPQLVIAAVDDSLTALRAVAYASGLARRNNAALVLMHVRSPFPAATVDIVGVYQPLPLEDDSGVALLRDLSWLTQQEFGVAAECVIRDGVPAREIARLARERQADIIVIGRPQSLLHRHFGSVQVRLTAQARCPVMVVP